MGDTAEVDAGEETVALFPPKEEPKPKPKPSGLGAWWTGALLKGIWWFGLAVTAGEDDLEGEADMTEKMPDADMASEINLQ